MRPSQIAILCLLTISSCLSVEARRRSRIDLPGANATTTTAPITDKIATVMAEKLEAKLEAVTAERLEATTTVQTDVAEEEKVSESNSSEESPAYEDCDLDNISFEMITG